MIKRQKYHLEPDRGLLNDPNGLVFYKDMYHVFFQWNRFEKNHSYKEWGHFTSKDLLHWNWEGSALLPDQFYEQNGVYSGSALIKDGQLRLFYTGNNKSGGVRKSSQCLAVTEDGKTFQKKGIVVSTPTEFTEHFRDPKVWQDGDDYYMVIGAQMKNGRGSVALCSSKDAENWKFELVLAKSKEYEMVECPDYFQVDGQGILLYCPQHRDNESDSSLCSFSAYKEFDFNDIVSGKIEDSNMQNLDEGRKKMDQGFDFYAPQSMVAPDGRRLIVAWANEWEWMPLFKDWGPTYQEGWCGFFNVIREVRMCKDGTLAFVPVEEMEKIRENKFTQREIQVTEKPQQLKAGDGISFEMKFTLDLEETDADRVELKLRCGKEKESRCIFDLKNGELLVDRSCADGWSVGTSRSILKVSEKSLDVHIFSDQSSLEIFTDQYRNNHSNNIFAGNDQDAISISAFGGRAVIRDYEAYGLQECFN